MKIIGPTATSKKNLKAMNKNKLKAMSKKKLNNK